MKTQTNNHIAALVLAIGTSLAASAMAGSYQETTLVQASGVETRTARVSLADLNLSSVEGQEALHGRVSQAAREVCGPTDFRLTGSIRVAADNRACRDSALADAMAQINAGQIASISISN